MGEKDEWSVSCWFSECSVWVEEALVCDETVKKRAAAKIRAILAAALKY